MLAATVLLGLVLLRLLALGGLAWLLIPGGTRCPACGEPTEALEPHGLARWLPGVTRRWCLSCGWSWYRKRERSSTFFPHNPRGERWARSTLRKSS